MASPPAGAVRALRTQVQTVLAPTLPPECVMQNEKQPQDSDPSEMTDFEKNTTQEELKQMIPDEPDLERDRQEKGNRGPNDEPGFGQGA
jgi:hypothetical protein